MDAAGGVLLSGGKEGVWQHPLFVLCILYYNTDAKEVIDCFYEVKYVMHVRLKNFQDRIVESAGRAMAITC